MFLKKTPKKDRVYLSIVQGYWLDGKSRQKTIQKIGYVDELESEFSDPIAHFTQVVKEMNESQEPKKIEISTTNKLSSDSNSRKNLGYAVPKKVYALLELNQLLQSKQNQLKNTEYNLNHIFLLLVFNRILEPSSKKKAFERRYRYFERADYSLDDVYRSLDHFSRYSKEIQKHLNQKISNWIGRDYSRSYYDVTNYYFEIPYNDDDVLDEEGNILSKGLRKKGYSKENRKTPIVQMGLLMDSNGLPMAYDIFPGNESEKTSMLPTIRRVKKEFEVGRIVVVADRGLNTSDNIALLAGKNLNPNHNDGYIYGQSVAGGSEEFKKWVLNLKDYVTTKEKDEDGDEIVFIHKSRKIAKTVTLKGANGKRDREIDTCQKQMAYYSKKYAKKQRIEREKMLEKARDLINNPGKYNKATSRGATSYIKNISFSKDTGEIVDGLDLSIDLEKIEEEARFDGFYAIVTSEIEMSDKEIRDAYRGLWKIEDSFKVIKSELCARPVHHWLEERINAHFLICFVGLLIIKLIELKLGGKYSIAKIRESLNSYSCSHIDQNYYLFDYRDEILEEIESTFSFDFTEKIMSTKEIKRILEYPK
jgi:transposase